MTLAKHRIKYLARQRKVLGSLVKLTVLEEITIEGYEDYSYGKEMSNPYTNGKEADAYRTGWQRAYLEMTDVKL